MGSPRRKANHRHKIKKVGPIWKCVLDCSYFVYFKQEYVILGNRIVCWNCNADFVADEGALGLETPFCYECRENPTRVLARPDVAALDKIAEVALKNQLTEVEALAKYQYEVLYELDWDLLPEEQKEVWRKSAQRTIENKTKDQPESTH